jgi:hypothetical protein
LLSGLAAANRATDEASAVEDEALLALCSYPCETITEARIKAEYLVAMPEFSDEFPDDNIAALLLSFLPQMNDDVA